MKKSILIIVVIIIAGIVFWMFKSKINVPSTETANTPTAQSRVGAAEISSINKDIESIDVGNTDQEFNDLNKDLQGL